MAFSKHPLANGRPVILQEFVEITKLTDVSEGKVSSSHSKKYSKIIIY